MVDWDDMKLPPLEEVLGRVEEKDLSDSELSDGLHNQSGKKAKVNYNSDYIYFKDECKEVAKVTLIMSFLIAGIFGVKSTMDYLLIEKPLGIYRSFLEAKDGDEKIRLGTEYLEYFKERKYDKHVKEELARLGMSRRMIETYDRK